jgi:hypothetical protein
MQEWEKARDLLTNVSPYEIRKREFFAQQSREFLLSCMKILHLYGQCNLNDENGDWMELTVEDIQQEFKKRNSMGQ